MSINKLYLDHFRTWIVENGLSPQSPSVILTYKERERPRYPKSKLHARKATTKELKMLKF
jgi:hypothetical protein